MQASFIRSATRDLSDGVSAALAHGVTGKDYRAALCRWEDDLFQRFPLGHGIIAQHEAAGLIETIFDACGRSIPKLRLVRGFDDPQVGGFADIARHCIVIEEGCLYRFLVLHEFGPYAGSDRPPPWAGLHLRSAGSLSCFHRHSRSGDSRVLLRHGLPSYTDLPRDVAVPIAA